MQEQAADFQDGTRAPVTSPNDKSVVLVDRPQGGSDSFKNYVLWSVIGVAAAGTLVWLGYKVVTNVVSNQANKGSLDSDDPAYFAKQFKIGFDNNNAIGVDTETVRQAMIAIPSKDFFSKVATNYHNQYKSSLFKDLETKLKSTEFQEMQAIYKIKPQKTGKNEVPIYDPYAWAARIHAAVNYETGGWFWGTDEEAIKQVMREISNQRTWDDVVGAYEAKYSLDIVQEIDGDVDKDEYDFRAELKKRNIAV
ncbi:hypothetical protein BH11BAC7_BH11BAC7_21300 [soil metagenome]